MRVLAILLALAAAQQQPAKFVTSKLADNVYWVSGGGGNSGIVIGKKGVIIVDAKTTAESGKQLLDEVAKLTPKPVTTVILTHSDGDHVNGLAAFPPGLTIIAQQNNKSEQEAALKAGGRGAPPSDRLPTKLIARSHEAMTIDGVKFLLFHWGPAHTNGDLIIDLPVQKIVFTGDIVATQRADPIIHLEKNGSTQGWLDTMSMIQKLDSNTFVPGHGDIQTKEQIRLRKTAIFDRRTQIKALLDEGKTPDEVRAAIGDPAPAPSGGRGPAFGTLVDIVHQENQKK